VCRREPFVCGNLFVENLNAQDVRPQVEARCLEADDEAQPIFPEFQEWYKARYEAQFIYPETVSTREEDYAYLYSQGCSC
jgi:hypothetical protein